MCEHVECGCMYMYVECVFSEIVYSVLCFHHFCVYVFAVFVMIGRAGSKRKSKKHRVMSFARSIAGTQDNPFA